MKTRQFIAIAIIVFIAVSASTHAANILVPSQYPTIQAGIDAATDGDTVIIAPGTYTGNGNRDIDFKGKAITVRSDNGGANCIIDCQGSGLEVHRGFIFQSGEGLDSVLEGITVTGGYVRNDGGAVFCDQSSPTIRRCEFIGNNGRKRGGAISCRFASPKIVDCVFKGNSSMYGGAVYAEGRGQGDFVNCIFTGNSATDGGAIYGFFGTVNITNCLVVGNTASNKWGAIYVSPSDAISLTNSIIRSNRVSSQYVKKMVKLESFQVEVSHCNIQADLVRINTFENGSGWGEGNIDADPMFFESGYWGDGWFDGIYYLKSDSPCLDAGINVTSVGTILEDIDGTVRPQDGDGDGVAVVDMGAYERGNAARAVVSDKRLEFSYVLGCEQPSSQTLGLVNVGEDVLEWVMSNDCSWIEISSSSGVNVGVQEEIAVTVNVEGLAAGEYEYELVIKSAGSGEMLESVYVSLSVIDGLWVPSEYATIQAGIDAAVDGDIIVIADGTYTGDGNRDIDFMGKAITVRSANGAASCTIDCQGSELEGHLGFVFESGEESDSVLEGITLTGGFVGAINCYQSSPTIRECEFVSNNGSNGGAVVCYFASPNIVDCVFEGNIARKRGGGLYLFGSVLKIDGCIFKGNWGSIGGAVYIENTGRIDFVNCVFTGNTADRVGGAISGFGQTLNIINCLIMGNTAVDQWGAIYAGDSTSLTNSIVRDNRVINPEYADDMISLDSYSAEVSYCNIEGGRGVVGNLEEGSVWGVGNIDVDPLFAYAGYWDDGGTVEDLSDDVWVDGDYHLLSAGWRWDAAGGGWTWDDVTSPCIDAGNPGMALGDEQVTLEVDPLNRFGVNKRINMGAYGGTAEASIAPPGFALLADITNDGTVDTEDLAILMVNWLITQQNNPADLSRDSQTDFADFALLAEDWLAQTTWFAP